MTSYFARHALLPSGWARDVLIQVDERGDFSAVSPGGERDEAIVLPGPVVPGMANLHSHAFQRGMAGLTEVRASPHDDFWSWRELMYQFVERLTPERAHAIAHFLYIEMLKHGYTAVGEFHYVHHPAEMLERHVDAARLAGIGMTVMPSVYTWSGFGAKPLQPRQRPFASTVEFALRQVKLLQAFQSPDVHIGVSPHSLRAVDPAALKELVAELPKDAPIHIHAAEQTKEVEDSIAALGKRPVEWLLDNFAVDDRWCFVHATHMTSDETRRLAVTGAVAGLCPTTEANLGDGIFPFLSYRAAGGRYGIGGDSHVSRNPAEELRMLEYVQRLTARRRNLAVSDTSKAVGTTLWLEATAGGAQALGRRMGALDPGLRADLVVLDGSHPDIAPHAGDAIANAFIFSGAARLVRDVMVAGRWVVRDGVHEAQETATEQYIHTLKGLLSL